MLKPTGFVFGIAACLAVVISPPVANAAPKYSELKEAGFATSRLIQRPSGAWGWYVSKDNVQYFCGQLFGLMRKGNRIGNFLQGGEFISMTLDEYRRVSVADPMLFPTYEEVMSGRPPAFVVGKCTRTHSQ